VPVIALGKHSPSLSFPSPFLLPFPSSPPLSTPCREAASRPLSPLPLFPSLPAPPLSTPEVDPVTVLPLPLFPSLPSPTLFPSLPSPFHPFSLSAPLSLPFLYFHPFPPLPPLPSPSLVHLRWQTLFCCVGCILRGVETSRISVVTDITHRF